MSFLLCWDYDRWRGLVPGLEPARNRHPGPAATWALFTAAAIGFIGVSWLHRAWLRHTSVLAPALLVSAGAALAANVAGISLRPHRR